MVVIILVILAVAGYFFMTSRQTAPSVDNNDAMASSAPSPMQIASSTITLDEQNESSESGTAVLTENNGKVTVVLNMTGAPEDTPQPAHIHVGKCPDVGEVKYPLTNVVNGTSETTIDATLDQLRSEQPLGINVHKSADEAKVYVSCGDLSL